MLGYTRASPILPLLILTATIFRMHLLIRNLPLASSVSLPVAPNPHQLRPCLEHRHLPRDRSRAAVLGLLLLAATAGSSQEGRRTTGEATQALEKACNHQPDLPCKCSAHLMLQTGSNNLDVLCSPSVHLSLQTDRHTTMTGSQALAGIQTTSKVTGTSCKEVSSRTEAQLTQPIGFQAICKGTFCGTRAHLTQHAAILISLSSALGLSRTGHPQRKTTTGLSLEMTAACQGKGSVCLGNPGSQDPRSWAWALLAAAMMLIQMTHIKTTESLGEDKNPAVLAAESAPLPPGQRGDLLGSTPEEVGQPRVPKCSGHLILACQMN